MRERILVLPSRLGVVLVAGIACAALVGGCNREEKPSIIGRWEAKDPDDVGLVTFEFKDDGTASMRKGDKDSMFKKYQFDATKSPHHLDLVSGDKDTELMAFTQEYLAQFEGPQRLKIACAKEGTWNFKHWGKEFKMDLIAYQRPDGTGFSLVGSSKRPEKVQDGEVWVLTKLK